MSKSSCLLICFSGLITSSFGARAGEEDEHEYNSTVMADLARSSCDFVYPYMSKDGVNDQCTRCVSQKPGWGFKCKWCSLKQKCRLSGRAGSSCDDSTQTKLEASVKSPQQCNASPPWKQLMDKAHGQDWIYDMARYADSIRCIQWTLGWPILPAAVGKRVTIDTSQGTRRMGITHTNSAEYSWLKVLKVVPGDLSAVAGLKAGHLITSLNGVTYSDSMKFTDAVKQIVASGGTLTIDYLESTSQSLEEVGNWGCVSALLREGIQAMLEEKSLPSAALQISDRASEQANTTASTTPEEFESQTWSPHLCSLIKSSVRKGHLCFIRSWQNFEFTRFRNIWPGLSKQLLESVRAGPVVQLSPGTGKSGSVFGILWDGSFKVKLGLKANQQVDEPQNLMRMMAPVAGYRHESLVKHFEDNPDSLINRVFGLLDLGLGVMRTHVAVLDDAFYHMDEAAKQAGLSFTRYDLKGKSRDQNEKKGSGWCLSNGDFTEREGNKLQLQDDQCLRLRAAVKADANFLESHNMIDYSLLLLSVKRSKSDKFTCESSQRPAAPFCEQSREHLYTLSIIDYLNDLSFAKSMESKLYALKHFQNLNDGKFNDYDGKFFTFVRKICRTGTEEHFHQTVLARVQQLGGTKKVFKSIDVDNNGYLDAAEIKYFLIGLGLDRNQISELLETVEYDAGPDDEKNKVSYKAFKWLLE